MKKTIKAWGIIREEGDKSFIDNNLDLDDFLLELSRILKKVDYDPIYSPAIFWNKRQAEKYLKRLIYTLECKVKMVPVEIKILT